MLLTLSLSVCFTQLGTLVAIAITGDGCNGNFIAIKCVCSHYFIITVHTV